MIYKIDILRPAQKQIPQLPVKIQRMIVDAIDGLRINPRPPNCRKLRGSELWRIRIGRYRIIYSIDDNLKLVTIVKVSTRQEDTYHRI